MTIVCVLVHSRIAVKKYLRLVIYKDKRFNRLTVPQAVQEAWRHLLGFWGGHRKLTIMEEGKGEAGTSYMAGERGRERWVRCHMILNNQIS